MDFSKSLNAWGTKRFDDVFMGDLADNQYTLPLHELCRAGGIPDDGDFEMMETTETHDEIVVQIDVSFKEMVPTSCADCAFPEERRGVLTIEIDKSTGEAQVKTDRLGFGNRNLEYY